MRSILFSLLFIFSFSTAHAVNEDLLGQIVTQAQETESSTLLIVQNGQKITSFGELYVVHNVQSVTKSVASLAIAILLREGKLKLEDPMTRWIPEWKADPVKSQITLKMIMNHTSGLPKGEGDFFNVPDIIERAIHTDLESLPGEKFHYSNIGATLLQTVIQQASGESVEDFVNSRVLTPLGITDEHWQKDANGHERTSGGLELSAVDLLKIGEAMLFDAFRCNTLLLEKSQPFAQYGLLWWLYDDMFYAKGWGGQFIVVNPKKNLIAIRTKDPTTVDIDQLEHQYFHDFVSLISKWE